MKSKSGFTLIELLVAFGFVAMATMSILALVRQSIRLVNVSQDLNVASQAAAAPWLGQRDLGAQLRQMRSEEIELGPIHMRSVVMEIIPAGRTEGVQVRLYK